MGGRVADSFCPLRANMEKIASRPITEEIWHYIIMYVNAPHCASRHRGTRCGGTRKAVYDAGGHMLQQWGRLVSNRKRFIEKFFAIKNNFTENFFAIKIYLSQKKSSQKNRSGNCRFPEFFHRNAIL